MSELKENTQRLLRCPFWYFCPAMEEHIDCPYPEGEANKCDICRSQAILTAVADALEKEGKSRIYFGGFWIQVASWLCTQAEGKEQLPE